MMSLGFMVLAIATGVMDQLGRGLFFYTGAHRDVSSAIKNPDEQYGRLPDACKTANGMVLLVILGGLITAFLVSIRSNRAYVYGKGKILR